LNFGVAGPSRNRGQTQTLLSSNMVSDVRGEKWNVEEEQQELQEDFFISLVYFELVSGFFSPETCKLVDGFSMQKVFSCPSPHLEQRPFRVCLFVLFSQSRVRGRPFPEPLGRVRSVQNRYFCTFFRFIHRNAQKDRSIELTGSTFGRTIGGLSLLLTLPLTQPPYSWTRSIEILQTM
jgi:hypothetical protein